MPSHRVKAAGWCWSQVADKDTAEWTVAELRDGSALDIMNTGFSYLRMGFKDFPSTLPFSFNSYMCSFALWEDTDRTSIKSSAAGVRDQSRSPL